jgi:hypothetical protein
VGALNKPKGKTNNSYNPCLVLNVVFQMPFLSLEVGDSHSQIQFGEIPCILGFIIHLSKFLKKWHLMQN